MLVPLPSRAAAPEKTYNLKIKTLFGGAGLHRLAPAFFVNILYCLFKHKSWLVFIVPEAETWQIIVHVVSSACEVTLYWTCTSYIQWRIGYHVSSSDGNHCHRGCHIYLFHNLFLFKHELPLIDHEFHHEWFCLSRIRELENSDYWCLNDNLKLLQALVGLRQISQIRDR